MLLLNKLEERDSFTGFFLPKLYENQINMGQEPSENRDLMIQNAKISKAACNRNELQHKDGMIL